MSVSGDESRTTAVGRKRKQVSEADVFGAAAAAAAAELRRLSNASKDYEDFQKTAGHSPKKASFSLRGASRPSISVDVSNNRQSNARGDGSSEEDGEIVESSGASMSNSADGMLCLHQLSDKDQDEQYKYFRLSRDNDIIYCMCCGDRGHSARACPTRRCTHCGAHDKHASQACPTYRKCTRCRRRGHDAPECQNPQPMIVAIDTCDICAETGHVEEECAKLWSTSLNPPLTVIDKKPKYEMLRACYHCGYSSRNGHWGDDCPHRYYSARTQGPNVVKTWSKKEAAKFMKPGPDTDDEDERGEYEAGQKAEDDEPAPAASRHWQVGLFDY